MFRRGPLPAVLAAIVLAGCLGPWLDGGSTPGFGDGDKPVDVALDVSRGPSGEADVRQLTLRVAIAGPDGSPDVHAGIHVPPEVEVLSGSTEYRGSVPPQGYELRVTIRPPPSREVLFTGWAEDRSMGPMGRPADVDRVGLSSEGSEIRPWWWYQPDPPGPTPMASSWPPPPLTTVRLEANGSDPYRVVAVVQSEGAFPFRAALWTSSEYIEEWEGNVTPMQPVKSEHEVPPFSPDDRVEYYGVRLVVFPALWVDETIHEDALRYYVTNSDVDVRNEPSPPRATNTDDTTTYAQTASGTPG